MTGPGSPQQWFTVLERYHPTTCTISDLIVGNAYSFRVFSENQCGLSATAATTKELARIQKAGGSEVGPTPSRACPSPQLGLCRASAPLPVGLLWVLLARAFAVPPARPPHSYAHAHAFTRETVKK